MRINQLRVSGYKGISDLEISPNGINIITGRNNTGKTSLLESIDLLFNPQNIRSYDDKVGDLINVHSGQAMIECELQKSQLELEDFGASDADANLGKLVIRSTENEEKAEYFVSVFDQILKLNEEYPPPFRADDASDDRIRELSNKMQDILRTLVSEIPEEELSSKIGGDCVVMKSRGNEYPYIYLDDYYDDIREDVIKETDNILAESPEAESPEVADEEELVRDILQYSKDMMIPRFGRGRFIGDEPPNTGRAKLIRDVKTKGSQFDLQKDKSATIKYNIEKYISENIEKDIVDFGFEKIVFEERDGEGDYEVPYSFMGDGFKTIVGLLWELFEEDNEENILLIEEAETHMHPGYVQEMVGKLIEVSRDKNIQLFITTHNLDFIEAFLTEMMAEDQQQYLIDEFNLIQLTEPGPKSYDYKQAKERVNEVDTDLRGI